MLQKCNIPTFHTSSLEHWKRNMVKIGSDRPHGQLASVKWSQVIVMDPMVFYLFSRVDVSIPKLLKIHSKIHSKIYFSECRRKENLNEIMHFISFHDFLFILSIEKRYLEKQLKSSFWHNLIPLPHTFQRYHECNYWEESWAKNIVMDYPDAD